MAAITYSLYQQNIIATTNIFQLSNAVVGFFILEVRFINKEFKSWLIILALNLIVVIACAYDSTHKEPVVEEAVEESETELIQWKDAEATEEVIVEDVEVETVTEPQEEVEFYNVPLSEELQLHIFKECEKCNIAPSLVIALIEHECRFVIDAVSPSGAEGPMQVMSKWHWDRMERLGCDDLSNPYQNITVGIDYLAELKDTHNDIVWVLMAYRYGGDSATKYLDNGVFPEYAISILERSSELAKEVQDSIK